MKLITESLGHLAPAIAYMTYKFLVLYHPSPRLYVHIIILLTNLFHENELANCSSSSSSSSSNPIVLIYFITLFSKL